MRHLLSRASAPVLSRLAKERTLCAFDFDGTLAPIVDHPDQAKMRDRTRQLLAGLAAEYPCVILSGRSRADLQSKLRGVPVDRVIGSHGAETGEARRRSRPRVQRWKAAIELRLADAPGLWVEDKGLSLAVHYRHAPRPEEARQQILNATQHLERVRVFGGKCVVNLVVDTDPHKGTALAAERDRLKCDWVLYVGDDENDEDAFSIGGKLVAVRIRRNSHTKAEYYLRSQVEIDQLIETLLLLRRPPGVAAG